MTLGELKETLDSLAVSDDVIVVSYSWVTRKYDPINSLFMDDGELVID